MTTIAYRDGVLAADSQATAGGKFEGSVVKIAKRGQCLAAVCGLAPQARAFLDWFRAGMTGDCPYLGDKDDCAWGFIYTPTNRVLWFKPGGPEDFHSPIHSTGSGAEIALGAMHAGATPQEAVAIAAKIDIHTGGQIRVLSR